MAQDELYETLLQITKNNWKRELSVKCYHCNTYPFIISFLTGILGSVILEKPVKGFVLFAWGSLFLYAYIILINNL